MDNDPTGRKLTLIGFFTGAIGVTVLLGAVVREIAKKGRCK